MAIAGKTKPDPKVLKGQYDMLKSQEEGLRGKGQWTFADQKKLEYLKDQLGIKDEPAEKGRERAAAAQSAIASLMKEEAGVEKPAEEHKTSEEKLADEILAPLTAKPGGNRDIDLLRENIDSGNASFLRQLETSLQGTTLDPQLFQTLPGASSIAETFKGQPVTNTLLHQLMQKTLDAGFINIHNANAQIAKVIAEAYIRRGGAEDPAGEAEKLVQGQNKAAVEVGKKIIELTGTRSIGDVAKKDLKGMLTTTMLPYLSDAGKHDLATAVLDPKATQPTGEGEASIIIGGVAPDAVKTLFVSMTPGSEEKYQLEDRLRRLGVKNI